MRKALVPGQRGGLANPADNPTGFLPPVNANPMYGPTPDILDVQGPGMNPLLSAGASSSSPGMIGGNIGLPPKLIGPPAGRAGFLPAPGVVPGRVPTMPNLPSPTGVNPVSAPVKPLDTTQPPNMRAGRGIMGGMRPGQTPRARAMRGNSRAFRTF